MILFAEAKGIKKSLSQPHNLDINAIYHSANNEGILLYEEIPVGANLEKTLDDLREIVKETVKYHELLYLLFQKGKVITTMSEIYLVHTLRELHRSIRDTSIAFMK